MDLPRTLLTSSFLSLTSRRDSFGKKSWDTFLSPKGQVSCRHCEPVVYQVNLEMAVHSYNDMACSSLTLQNTNGT